MTRFVLVFATCDTKGAEARYLVDRLRSHGVPASLIDTGGARDPDVPVDVTREQVFLAAGTNTTEVTARGDRGFTVDAAARGAESIARSALERGELAGVIGIGGSAGTTIGTAAMRALPLGVPKLMISTLASGPVRQYVRDKDVLMLNSVVDISGVNRISRLVLANAAAAMAGMVQSEPLEPEDADRPLIAASMFGVTTPCVERARRTLERAGYEVLVFHATGNGGQALESLVREGLVAGVLDLTTTELADELVGGVLSAGPERLTAAAETGTPQVVSVGATDMVNFLGRDTVPERFEGRVFHEHNANVTLMRTTPLECTRIGADLGDKLSCARGPVSIYLPTRGVSAIDGAGQPFDNEGAREALFAAIRAHAGDAEVVELDHHINDPEFADAAASRLLELIGAEERTS